MATTPMLGAPSDPKRSRPQSGRPWWKKLSWNKPAGQSWGAPHQSSWHAGPPDVRQKESVEPLLPVLLRPSSGKPEIASSKFCGVVTHGAMTGAEATSDSDNATGLRDAPLSPDLLLYLTQNSTRQPGELSMERRVPERLQSPFYRRRIGPAGKLPSLEARPTTAPVEKPEAGTSTPGKTVNQMGDKPLSDTPTRSAGKAKFSQEDSFQSQKAKAKERPGRVARKMTSGQRLSRKLGRQPTTIPEESSVENLAIEPEEDNETQEEPICRIRERAGSNFVATQKRRSTVVEYKNEFQYLMALMRRHNISISELRAKRAEFNQVDSSGCGVISKEEFHKLVRKRVGYSSKESLPHHLCADHWLNSAGLMDFEMYLLWSLSTAYSEEMMVACPRERHLRQVARSNQINDYVYVEKVKSVFDTFDEDRSDHIDESEFEKVIYVLMNARQPSDISPQMLKRFWREVDTDGSGEITFEEFLLWYFKFMGEPS